MITGNALLWWAVLLSYRASFHALAIDHPSVGQTYKSLPFRSNASSVIESTSPSHAPDPFSNASPFTSSSPSVSLPHASFKAASYASSATPGASSVKGAGNGTPPDSRDGEIFPGGARSSGDRILGDTFIASITTLPRPPLVRPHPSLASQINSTGSTFPTLPQSTTNNVTTTQGRYTNSSAPGRPATTTQVWTTTTGLTSATAPGTATAGPTSTTVPWTTSQGFCTVSSYGSFTTVIEYSIVHTWTITWLGDPAEYTPPFPTISTPTPCSPVPTSATGRFTVSACDGSEQSCTLLHPSGSDGRWATDPWYSWTTSTSINRGMEPTLTFVTTDKNPAVVFPTSPPPDYGGTPDPMANVHSAAFPNQVNTPDAPDYGNKATTWQNVKSAPTASPPPVTVTVKPSVVVIDGETFTNNPAQPTSTVVVGRNTFTINPTQVVGVGATVTRPPSGRALTPAPVETTVGGIEVDVHGGSTVVIDKTPFTIGPRPSAVVVRGQTITLGPGVIVFPSQTLALPTARDDAGPTTRVVVGAELITAIGSDRVVIAGRTITYGPGSGTITEVVDGDTVLIGPSGVVAHGETYGGRGAAATDTQLAVVGGVTISQIGLTQVVVQGVTYTIDPLAPGQTATTTVLGGETVTIGPGGVAIETWTLDSPYASTTTITPGGGATGTVALPTAAGTNKKNPSLASRQPPRALTAWILAGAGVLGTWLL